MRPSENILATPLDRDSGEKGTGTQENKGQKPREKGGRNPGEKGTGTMAKRGQGLRRKEGEN